MKQVITVSICWEDLTKEKRVEIEQEFIRRKVKVDEIDYSGPKGDGVIGRIEVRAI